MFSKKKKSNYFFDAFPVLCNFALKEIEELQEGIKDFDNKNLFDLKNKIHQIEHEADLKKKEIEEKLAKEFMTPIDREDIFILLDEIDDLSDAIDEIPYKLYMRNYKTIPEDTPVFAEVAKETVIAINEVLSNFHKINNRKVVLPLIENVLSLEEKMDKMYEDAVRKLYTSSKTYDEARLFERIYNYFENVSDKCRDICKTATIIMYKNL